MEIIIINDLSTDKSEDIILEFTNKYDFIKYQKLETKAGVGGARNFGLRISEGKYIGFVDSNDWVDTLMYKKLIESIEKNEADISICGVKTEYDCPQDTEFRYRYDVESVLTKEFALTLLTRRYNQDISISPIVCNKIYKRDFLINNKLKFEENTYNEDIIFNYLSFLNSNKIVVIPSVYYHYYQRMNSITNSFSKKHIDDLINAFKLIKDYLRDKNLLVKYRECYFSYFEKSLTYVLKNMLSMEKRSKIQKKYFKYFFLQSRRILSFDEYLEYVSVERLIKFIDLTK